MCRYRMMLVMACLCCGVAKPAFSQGDIGSSEWSRATTLNALAGAAFDSGHAGPLIGGTVGWEVLPGLAIEGSGTWLDFGHRSSAYAGALTVRARLFGRRTIDPFVQGGVGMYRASFGPGDDTMPNFYQRRMGPGPHGLGQTTFTDPTLLVGGGVNVFINRHLAIRPDLLATFVLRGGHQHVVTSIGVHAVYHFEDHPVTPAR